MLSKETKCVLHCNNCDATREVKLKDIIVKEYLPFIQIADFYCFQCTAKCQPAWIDFVID